MTENEAIIQLNFDMEMIRFNPSTGESLTLEQIKAYNEDNYKTYLADELAITALLEIQQYRAIGSVEEILNTFNAQQLKIASQHNELEEYRAIGTIDEFKALKEKSTKKRFSIFESHGIRQFVCSCCDRPIRTTDNYCSFCGQKLDWQ